LPDLKVSLFDYYKPHARQRAAHLAREKFILFGGAVGGGKSVFLVMDALWRCLAYRWNKVGIFRWEHSSYMKTTHETLSDWILNGTKFPQGPSLVAKHDQQKHVIVFHNGSQIRYGGLKPSSSASGDILSIAKSLELSSFYLDELTDFPRDVFQFVGTRTGRTKAFNPYKGAKGEWEFPPARVAATCNPHLGWVKNEFVDKRMPNHVFIPSRAKDNPYNSQDYIQGIKEAFGGDMQKVAQYVDGDWSAVVDYDCIYWPVWLMDAAARKLKPGEPRTFGVDVAAHGNDRSVVWLREGPRARVLWTAQSQSTAITTDQIEALADEYCPEEIRIDSVGVGQGPCDELIKRGYNVIPIIGGASPDDDRFINRRSEIYWGVRKLLEAGEIDIPDDPDVINELGCIKYQVAASDRTIKVESKKEIRKRLGNSPDLADGLVYAFAGAGFDYILSGSVTA